MEDQDFSKLEAVVEKLLAALGATRDENVSLLARLQDKDQKIEELEQKIQVLDSDRAEVSGRVSSLIDSIENWQNSTGPSPVQGTEDAAAEAPGLFADSKEDGND